MKIEFSNDGRKLLIWRFQTAHRLKLKEGRKKMSIIFANKYIEDAVRKTLNITEGNDISACAMERIKYLRIGDFGNDFVVEISAQNPPEPFSATDGGDEWSCALRGKQIENFLKQEQEGLLRPSMFGYDDEDNWDADSDEAVNTWEIYETTIISESCQEQIEGLDECEERWNQKKQLEWDEGWNKKKRREWTKQWNTEKNLELEKLWKQWHEKRMHLICQDLPHFTGLEVLRIQELTLPDYAVFHNMKSLKTLELAQTYFLSIDGYEKLLDLQQLSCWLD